MIAIFALGVVLYTQCFHLLLSLRRMQRAVRRESTATHVDAVLLEEIRGEAEDTFARRRIPLGAMIAAAPLLGLLGTVTGMAKTFAGLADRAGEKSLDALAMGVSEVLVATESGLAVAIPALVLVWLAHAETQRIALQTVKSGGLRERGKGSC